MSCAPTSRRSRSAPQRRCATLPPPTGATSWLVRSRARNLTPRTITELAAALRDGSTTPRALLDAALAHVDRTETDLNAYLTVTRELASTQADAAAQTLEAHPDTASPLCGIPMALK